MSGIWPRKSIAFAAVALGAFASGPAVAANPPCIQSWGEAAQIVSVEKLATVETLTRLTRRALDGQLVRTMLCQEDGRYVYKIVVRTAAGSLRHLEVDARHPFGPPIANK